MLRFRVVSRRVVRNSRFVGAGLSLAIIVRVSYVECVRLRGRPVLKGTRRQSCFSFARIFVVYTARGAIILITGYNGEINRQWKIITHNSRPAINSRVECLNSRLVDAINAYDFFSFVKIRIEPTTRAVEGGGGIVKVVV